MLALFLARCRDVTSVSVVDPLFRLPLQCLTSGDSCLASYAVAASIHKPYARRVHRSRQHPVYRLHTLTLFLCSHSYTCTHKHARAKFCIVRQYTNTQPAANLTICSKYHARENAFANVMNNSRTEFIVLQFVVNRKKKN